MRREVRDRPGEVLTVRKDASGRAPRIVEPIDWRTVEIYLRINAISIDEANSMVSCAYRRRCLATFSRIEVV